MPHLKPEPGFPILGAEFLAPTIKKLVIKAPLVARKRKAGHFVMVRAADDGERIPLTVVDSDPLLGTITLIVQAVGKTTHLLLARQAGDRLVDVLGPLGNPTPIEHHGAVACVGGGVGTAELLPIARSLRAAGNELYSIVGARSKDLVILDQDMAAVSRRLYVTTDDGSRGLKGLVTDVLAELFAAPLGIAAVYAIGPLPMMKAVANLTRPLGVRTLVSLNAIMVDGTGMCGGCRVSVSGQMRFACVDGPEFDGHGVDFDELMQRNRAYADLERVSLELARARSGGARRLGRA